MSVRPGNILAMLAGGLASAWTLWMMLAALLDWRFVPPALWGGVPLGSQPIPLVLIGLLSVAVTDFRHGWSRSSTVALVLCLMPFAILGLGSFALAAFH